MTKKHFIKAAQMIANMHNADDRFRVAHFMVKFFQEENPRFNTKTFLTACNFHPDTFETVLNYQG